MHLKIKYDNFNMFTTANLTSHVKGQDASYYEVRYFIKLVLTGGLTTRINSMVEIYSFVVGLNF